MSGSCAFAIRDEYQHFLEGQPEWQQRAEKLSGKNFMNSLNSLLMYLGVERRLAHALTKLLHTIHLAT